MFKPSNSSPASRGLYLAISMAIACGYAAPVRAGENENIAISASYTADVTGVAAGGVQRGARYLDNIDIITDLDLEGLAGWSGAKAHFYLLNNLGGRPNDLAGTVQGVDNIEVGRRRAKLYEAWIEQNFGDRASLLLGLYDLNSEFYANDSAGLLIAPAFGIGSELSATGPNGPSIFPSTALTARLRLTVANGYAMVAVVNAHAGTIGDPGGIKTSFDNGVLSIAEAGHAGDRGKLAVGLWAYSKRQPRIDAGLPTAAPSKPRSRGAYMIAEARLAGDENTPRAATAFVRAGVSDGRTTPFRGGWQAGLLIDRPFAGRPEGQFSIGIAHAYLSSAFRRVVAPGSPRLRGSETGFEITYSDRVLPFLTLQPDLQYIRNPGGDRSLRDAVVVGMRATISFDFAWSGRSAGRSP